MRQDRSNSGRDEAGNEKTEQPRLTRSSASAIASIPIPIVSGASWMLSRLATTVTTKLKFPDSYERGLRTAIVEAERFAALESGRSPQEAIHRAGRRLTSIVTEGDTKQWLNVIEFVGNLGVPTHGVIRWYCDNHGAIAVSIGFEHPDRSIEVVSPSSRHVHVMAAALSTFDDVLRPHITFREDAGHEKAPALLVDGLTIVHHSHPLVTLSPRHALVRRWLSRVPLGAGVVISRSKTESVTLEADDVGLADLGFERIGTWKIRNSAPDVAGRAATYSVLRRIKPAVADTHIIQTFASTADQALAGKRIAVVGANIGGLSCAHELARHGAAVTLLERLPFVGRTCSTFEMAGCRFDLGEHLYPLHVPESKVFWHTLMSIEDFIPVYYNHGWFADGRLAPSVNSVQHIGVYYGKNSLISFADSYFKRDQDAASVEDELPVLAQAIRANGSMFAETFVAGFMRRRTGRDWLTVNPRSIAAYIHPLRGTDALQEIIKDSRLSDEVGHLEENARANSERVRHIASSFRSQQTFERMSAQSGEDFARLGAYYPREGAGMLTAKLADRIRAFGGSVLLKTIPKSLSRDDGGRILTVVDSAGAEHHVDHVVVADPREICEAIGVSMQKADDSQLFVIYVALVVKARDLGSYTTILVKDETSLILRITNFSNWSPDMVLDDSVIGLGVELRHSATSNLDELAKWDDDRIVDLVAEDLERMKLVSGDEIVKSRVFKVPAKTRPSENIENLIPNLSMLTATNLAELTRQGLSIARTLLSTLSSTNPRP